MKYIKAVTSFFKFLGTPNWYKGIDKPNAYQRFYKWRIGFKTAWALASGIWLNKFK
jgi:hypothetical protein